MEGVCYLQSVRNQPGHRLSDPDLTWPDTAQRIPAFHSRGCARSHGAALSAVLPATMSIGLPHRPPQGCTKPWSATGPDPRNIVSSTPNSLDCPYPVGVRFQQRLDPTGDLVVNWLPATPKFHSNIVDRAIQTPHLDGHPAGRSRCLQPPHRTNRGALFDERSHLTSRTRARPTALPPPQQNGRPNAGRSTNTTLR